MPDDLGASPPISNSLSNSESAIAVKTVDMRVDYGEHVAVHGLNLAIPRGEVFGLVGPNGAGKTSTFKVLATLMEPTYGDVFLSGIDIAEQPGKARAAFAYMPDLAPVPTDLKVWEFLSMVAASHGIRRGYRAARVNECLEKVSLTDKREAMCKTLSRGMKQRLVLAKCLMHRPDVLLLDEPASGMDPISRVEMRNTLRSLASEGATVLISSHILTELADLCSSVGIMSLGHLIESGPISEVVDRLGGNKRSLTVTTVEKTSAAIIEFLQNQSLVEKVAASGATVSFDFSGSDDEQATLLTQLISSGLRIRSFEEKKSNIEEVILGLKDTERSR